MFEADEPIVELETDKVNLRSSISNKWSFN